MAKPPPYAAAPAIYPTALDAGAGINPFVPIHPAARWGILLTVLGFGILTSLSAASSGGANSFLVITSNWLFLFAVALPLVRYSATFGWAHPLVLTANITILSILARQYWAFSIGLPAHPALPNYSASELALLYAWVNVIKSLALFALYIGYFIGPKLPVPALQASDRHFEARPAVLLTLYGLGVLAFIFIVSLSGSFLGHLKNITKGASARVFVQEVSGRGQFTIFVLLATTVVAVWISTRPKCFRSPIFWLLAIGAVGMSFMQSGRRTGIFAPVMTWLPVYVLRHQIMPLKRGLIIAGVLFVAFSVATAARHSNKRGSTEFSLDFFQRFTWGEILEDAAVESASRAAGGNAVYPIVAKVPSDVDMLWGKGYVRWLYLYIPRYFWESKPRGMGHRVAETFFQRYDVGGIPPGPVGAAWWNFHLPGVIGVYFLWGAVLKWAGSLILKYPYSTAAIVIYVVTVIQFNPSQNGARSYSFGIITALVALLAAKLLRPQRA